MYDFHLHLLRLPYPAEIGATLLQSGCGFNNVACEPWEWEKSLELKGFLEGSFVGARIHHAFGIHPMVATKVTTADINRLEQILRSDNYTIGECGLDKRFDGYEPAGIQEQIFKKQVILAKELNRPLQIHCVGDYFRILRFLAEAEPQCKAQSPQPPVIFHRFGGDANFVKAALKQLGVRAIFSLHADSFRKKSTAAAIKEIPPAQVRFETDADESFKISEQSIEVAAPIAATAATATTEASTIAEAILRQLRQAETKFF